VTVLGIIDYRATRHIDVAVLAICTMTAVLSAITAMPSKDMTVVAQMKQGPEITVATQIDVASPSTIAPVGPSVGSVLGAVHMGRSSSAFAGATDNLYVVYEVGFHFLK
jgi:hypothetical protein